MGLNLQYTEVVRWSMLIERILHERHTEQTKPSLMAVLWQKQEGPDSADPEDGSITLSRNK